jgi:hypothetical protein
MYIYIYQVEVKRAIPRSRFTPASALSPSATPRPVGQPVRFPGNTFMIMMMILMMMVMIMMMMIIMVMKIMMVMMMIMMMMMMMMVMHSYIEL